MLINMELLSLDSNNTHDLFKYQLIFTNLGMYVSRISIFILVILLICFNQWLQKKKNRVRKILITSPITGYKKKNYLNTK